jgi:hypothetical protein
MTWSVSVLEVFFLYAKLDPVRDVQHLYIYRSWPIEEGTNRHSSNNTSTCYVSLFFLSFFYHRALEALGFGDLCRFVLKSGRLSSTKARGSLFLCSESNRPSSRKYDSIVVLRCSFAWQHTDRLGRRVDKPSATHEGPPTSRWPRAWGGSFFPKRQARNRKAVAERESGEARPPLRSTHHERSPSPWRHAR